MWEMGRDSTCNDDTSLMELITTSENLARALKAVCKNQGAPGIDGMTCETLKRWFRIHHKELAKRLLEGTYTPSPVRRVSIPKANGKGLRHLGIPTAKDRLVQQAILQVIQPIIDPTFSESSFGFRPGRSAHQAIDRAKEHVTAGYRVVVDIDLADFFNEVHHDILMSRLEQYISDRRVLRLVRQYLRSGIMLNGCQVITEKGTPQGGPLSPLLSNVMLDELDKELERRGHRFCRYADDANIYVQSMRAGERVLASVTHFLERRLRLKVNSDKSAVDKAWKRKFLGFSLTNHRVPKARLARPTVDRFRARIRELTRRTEGISMKTRIRRLNQYLSGWIGYFWRAETPTIFQQLQSWLYRRLRLCEVRRWKRKATRWRRLVALGVSPKQAAEFAASSKGWWRLSLTPQLHQALGLAYWQARDVLDLTVLYRRKWNVS